MTQSPHSGQAAPMTPEFDPAGPPRPVTDPEFDYNGSVPGSGPSPSSPSTSTPWGSTSTAAGAAPNFGNGQSAPAAPAAPAAPTWTSTPLGHADAPTASVPLVQEPIAPTPSLGAPAAPAAPTNRGARTARARGPRRARLQLRHVNPWTVLKFSCVLSIALFFVWLIVIGVLFGVLDGAGAIDKINSAVTTLQAGNAKPPITAGIVFGGAAIIGVVNIVLFIALSTVGSVVYNLCADLVGGIEVTLSER
jgi:Transmembrane domain of unknown function (DUF3566)